MSSFADVACRGGGPRGPWILRGDRKPSDRTAGPAGRFGKTWSGRVSCLARQSGFLANVRFGSKADIQQCLTNVRFTPKSGHWNSVAKCPLCAKSGHRARRIQLCRPPAAKKDKKREIVSHQQRRHPKRGNPVCGSHKRRRVVDRCERDGANKVERTHNIKKPHQQFRASRLCRDRWNGDHCQDSCNKIAVGGRVGKLWRNARIGAPDVRNIKPRRRKEWSSRIGNKIALAS